jgi:glycosyltransferase involved in cell wall biosynthesis
VSQTVSVILPVYNGASFLRDAIESALKQTHAPLEVIVVDDGSTDATPKIAQSLPVTYIRQENQGVSAARNLAIEGACGDYLALLDADDIWEPAKLAVQLDLLAGTRDAYATCHLTFFTEDGKPPPKWFRWDPGHIGTAGMVIPSCWMIPRPVWDRVGQFRKELRVAEDVDWLARAIDSGIRTLISPEVLVRKRLHENNLTGLVKSNTQVWMDTLRQSLQRKRVMQRGER